MDQPGPAPGSGTNAPNFVMPVTLPSRNRNRPQTPYSLLFLSLFRCVYKDDLILSHQAQFFRAMAAIQSGSSQFSMSSARAALFSS